MIRIHKNYDNNDHQDTVQSEGINISPVITNNVLPPTLRKGKQEIYDHFPD